IRSGIRRHSTERAPRSGRHRGSGTGQRVWFDTTMHAGPETLPDALLVVRCRRGDREAWDELVNRFSRYVYAIAVRAYRLDRDEAEEVFQEVFARGYQRLGSLREDDALRPLLRQFTR